MPLVSAYGRTLLQMLQVFPYSRVYARPCARTPIVEDLQHLQHSGIVAGFWPWADAQELGSHTHPFPLIALVYEPLAECLLGARSLA